MARRAKTPLSAQPFVAFSVKGTAVLPVAAGATQRYFILVPCHFLVRAARCRIALFLKLFPMSKFTIRALPLALSLAFPALSVVVGSACAADEAVPTLAPVTVSASKTDTQTLGATVLAPDKLVLERSRTSDTTRLLGDVPGVGFYGAGGVSSLPVIHGLADDRLRIKVDGMDLVSACANHMNAPLSYIDPSSVDSIQVFTGITPVSAGGDSIGGTIAVNSPPPVFAKAGEGVLTQGQVGAFYRSNGNGRGGNVALTVANDMLSMTYRGASTQASNYKAAADFKPAGMAVGAYKNVPLDANEVGASGYQSVNQSLAFALRHDDHMVELTLGMQNIPYQGFPNQRMDMTSNKSEQANLRFTRQTVWGSLEARAYAENTRHAMNFGDEKSISLLGMPMDTEGKTTGLQVKADVQLSERDTVKVGADLQRYRLNDWWDPVSAIPGGMSPNTFWNIREGQRDRFDVFGELTSQWTPQWLSQVGLRTSTMSMDTGPVQAYNTVNGAAGSNYAGPIGTVAQYDAFNAQDHKRTDNNIDVSALSRFTPDAQKAFAFGYSRKTRSPNLYERFAWSTNNPMIMNMVNWSGDANGYVGNLALNPEIAHKLSATADWHDAARTQWGFTVSPYFTYVQDYIDASRCSGSGVMACTAANLTRQNGFVYLQFVNQSARIYGADVSGFWQLARSGDYGTVTATGMLNWVKGKNATTDDNLYNTMPLNAKLAVVQKVGPWTNTVETQWVDAKSDVSQVRNELTTAGYGLLNLRTRYDWKQASFDLGVDNALDKFYASPLGGAYVGQGNVMGTGAVYGIAVPSAGRSLFAGVTVKF